MISTLILAHCLLCPRPAAAQESPKKTLWTENHPPTPGQIRAHEFSSWYFETARGIELPAEIISLIWEPKLPESIRLFNLAHHIARVDPVLRRYLARVEELHRKNKRLNPFDIQLLSRLEPSAQDKRELADRLDAICGQAGVPKPKRQSWKDTLSSTSGSLASGSLRYDVETGRWERYDADKKTWEQFRPAGH